MLLIYGLLISKGITELLYKLAFELPSFLVLAFFFVFFAVEGLA